MPSVAVNPPKTPVTKGSNGIASATLPNICKMPGPPAPFVPTPLPNIGQSGKQPDGYSTTVKIEGEPVAIAGASFGSSGDIASKGTGGGVVSNNAEGPTKFIAPGSMNVQIEGKNVQQLGDQMMNNCGPGGSPANAATMMGTVQTVLISEDMPASECDACTPKSGSRADVERKSYEGFFSEDERKAFDQLAAETPDLVPMLPPKDGLFIRTNQSKVESRRKRYKKQKDPGEFHHPNSLKTGGCPVHQRLVPKPDRDTPEGKRRNDFDQKINAITKAAQDRAAGK
jgi:uncharacterized Zn-binding protein involved in type VI secretion